jgi:SAM-dependent methyltransferase
MDIYQRLAPYYDDYFPQSRQATSFLIGLTSEEPWKGREGDSRDKPAVIDFGCATGSQLLDLAEAGWSAIGCEPCAAMLEIARRKALARGASVDFEAREMLEAAARIQRGSVDLALCLGNTLPHLRGEDELERFIAEVAALLAPGGYLVLQLLNYKRILASLAGGEYRFPILRSGESSFERSYAIAPDGKPVFRVELVESGRRFVETGRLSFFSREAIVSRLTASGFERIASCSGWDGAPFDASSDSHLILAARQP